MNPKECSSSCEARIADTTAEVTPIIPAAPTNTGSPAASARRATRRRGAERAAARRARRRQRRRVLARRPGRVAADALPQRGRRPPAELARAPAPRTRRAVEVAGAALGMCTIGVGADLVAHDSASSGIVVVSSPTRL